MESRPRPARANPTRTLAALLCVSVLGCSDDAQEDGSAAGGPSSQCTSDSGDANEPVVHPMSFTRLLRRVTLSLTGRTPTTAAYDAIVAAADDTAREALIQQAIDEALSSPAFYRSLVAFGHDWLGVGLYANGLNDAAYHGSQAANLVQCAADTVNAGKWAMCGEAEGPNDCSDAGAQSNAVEPWWAMGSSIEVVGRAGTGTRGYVASDGTEIDCGLVEHEYFDNGIASDPDGKCSCGPNLVYCHPGSGFANAKPRDPSLAAMQVWDEPARFLAHLVWHDRSLSDLVLANYTVAPLRLRHLYVRHGRQNPEHKALDDRTDWYAGPFGGPTDPEHEASDPLAWNEVVVERLHPDLLSLTPDQTPSGSLERSYKYDPRTTTEEIEGMPAAGVLSMPGSMASFARERVRAARFIEALTCRKFLPPPADFVFEDFNRDPATTGTCQHCHRTMDPAATFFKRWSFRPSGTGGTFAILGGVGRWRFTQDSNVGYDPFERWVTQFLPETVMTPATEQQYADNPEVLLMDFLPEGTLLFGQQGDGTVGPLGFGKILVDSGELDRCAVQRIYERFVGRALDATTEAGYIDALSNHFVEGDRQVRPFLLRILATDDFRRGL
jgi:hypothetical protein